MLVRRERETAPSDVEAGGLPRLAPATAGKRGRDMKRVVLVAAVAAVVGFGTTGASAATPLPAHVFAPYFETWTTDSISTTASQSGVRYFTLAFLETLGKRSCMLAWNGSSSQTIPSGRYLSDIA